MGGYTEFSNALYERWMRGAVSVGSLMSRVHGGDIPHEYKKIDLEGYGAEAILIIGLGRIEGSPKRRHGGQMYQAIYRQPEIIIHGDVCDGEQAAILSLEGVIASTEHAAPGLPRRIELNESKAPSSGSDVLNQ